MISVYVAEIRISEFYCVDYLYDLEIIRTYMFLVLN